ncbi:hypothetical protein BGX38DRAFT_1167345 [Terfezia claveryi]|nr:hypothetical protein BGX38DRAFT_1167345 [Terfezia claveryi]
MLAARATPVVLNAGTGGGLAFVPGSWHAHPTTASNRTTRKEKHPGFGWRDVWDRAPFTLWNNEEGSYRNETLEELAWMMQAYDAQSITIDLPVAIIRTKTPPSPVPITVAGCLARFVPPEEDYEHLCGQPIGRLCPYGTIQVKDPISYALPQWDFPSKEQCYEVLETLNQLMRIMAIHFFPPTIVVELDHSIKYNRKSLPKTVGGLNLLYHHDKSEYFDSSFELALQRLITPSETHSDTSKYPILSPGVAVSSSPLSTTTEGYADVWRSTTAGIALRNGHQRRVTLANHGFQESLDVYHPSPHGAKIGTIVARYEPLDLALMELEPHVRFTNGNYFAATPPKRLCSIWSIKAGDVYSADGFSTGVVDCVARSRSLFRPANNLQDYPVLYREWQIYTVFSTFGVTGSTVVEGICGAPLVDEEGNVGGFFRFSDKSGTFTFSPPTDFLSFMGWGVE